MSEELDDRRLRDAFASLAETAGDGSRCPEAERLWASARQELSGRENEEVILHISECTACATAWRLARELSLSSEVVASATAGGPRPAPHLLRRWVPLLAAAALVLGVAGSLIRRAPQRTAEEPVYRSNEGRWLESQVPAGAALPRGAFVLRWAAGPKGTTYDLHVTGGRLEPLARVSRLQVPEYRVETEKLAAVASGDRVLWRVIAHLPDGRLVASRTFATALE